MITFYFDEKTQEMLSIKDKYVKMSLNVKVGGLQYRPEIKITGCGLNFIEDYNEITNHLL
jgi:hypothetical protein